MGTVILHGWAKKNDPIYRSGPVIGGKRFSNLPKIETLPPEPKTQTPKRRNAQRGEKSSDRGHLND